VNLDDPAVTVELLRHDAVVGVTGIFQGSSLQSVGIQCALCHSVVNNSLAPGIGERLDGWANRDLDIGAIVATAPDLSPFATLLGVDESTVRTVLNSWGPGKFDAELVLDGKAFRPDGRSSATLIPPAFGMAGVNLHTWTGWGSVTHWNAFVSNLEMHGKGTFFDPRLDDAATFPIAAREGFGHVRNTPDLITAKLPGLHFYQLAIPAPAPPEGSFDRAAAEDGEALFEGKAQCASCHVSPLYTEPGWNMHTPAEIGIDDFQANRSPDKRYRTAPLGGLWTHTKGGFYHDGRFSTLLDVVNHYDGFFKLGLSPDEKSDLVEYLKSLPDDEVSEPEDKTEKTSGKEAPSAFGRAVLDPPFPNPATSRVAIPFSLSSRGEVELSIFDVSGRRVVMLTGGTYEPGGHSVTWDGQDEKARRVAPGVYFSRLTLDGRPQAEQRIVIRR
jgi:mono/diheme cytochrome c family protein